ncbi:TPA: hypothetical protein QDB19_004907 [Burkholderia vietnamiensis]|nr:hypothetical protein [Burkholderia vietnamiensis]
MARTQTTAYSPRMPSSEAALRIRLEPSLSAKLRETQADPKLALKEDLKPSTTLIVRRALQRYFEHLATMKEADITAEVLALHRLAISTN